MTKREKKEFLHGKFKVKAVEEDKGGDEGFLAGYLSVFGNMDYGMDIAHRGMFKHTINMNGGKVPMLLDHDPYSPAGYTTTLKEDSFGLYYEARVKLYDPRVKQRFELAKMALEMDAEMGNSFGYIATKFDFEELELEDGSTRVVRNLREVKLLEGSLVTFPMNDEAGVTDAKAMIDLIVNSGYSVNDIYKALTSLEEQAAKRNLDPDAENQSIVDTMEDMRSIFA